MISFFTAHSYLFSQIFGFTAMGLAIITYQFNKQRTVNLMLMAVAAVWCLHYAALGLFTPILMNVLNVVRAGVYSRSAKKPDRKNFIPVLFCIASCILVAVTWTGLPGLLPGAASISASVANWQKDPKKLRAFTVPVCVCWLIYNALNGSIAGVCNETFTLISIAVAFFRYDVPRRRGGSGVPEREDGQETGDGK